MTVRTALAADPSVQRQRVLAALDDGVVKELRARFPGRVVPMSWPASTDSRLQVLARLDRAPLRADGEYAQAARLRGAAKLLRWLETVPGASWQERWLASGVQDLGGQGIELAQAWLNSRGESSRRPELNSGLLALFCADIVRPDLRWLARRARSAHWREAVAIHRDPAGFALLQANIDPAIWSSKPGGVTRQQIAMLLVGKGGGVADITVGDCLQLRVAEAEVLSRAGYSRSLFYTWLKQLGNFPDSAPTTLRYMTRYGGQLTPDQLVDRYDLQCRPIRDLIVDYLAERQPALDYTSLRSSSTTLALNFWRDLEVHHPGIHSLHLEPRVAAAWKERLKSKIIRKAMPDGTVIESTSPRRNYPDIMMGVRAFYLDIAQWALDDPARWGQWAAPCPIKANEADDRKFRNRRKARMDQRTRERLPALPDLVRAAETHLKNTKARLEAARAVQPGQSFTVLGETFTSARSKSAGSDSCHFVFTAAGRRYDLGLAEHRAFWAWAAIEFLRHTGVRLEEMLESTHHSITQYRLPDTGEIIPLLQIAPSKMDEERLLVVGPELADVLSAIVCRIRDASGAVPMVPFYDRNEKVWTEPMPLLFQWRTGGQSRPISMNTIRRALDDVLAEAGLVDAAGELLLFQPHDFRRLFTTEAILNGMPPHIAQLLLGHKDINTTMGYKAIYPQEAINGHRAFIARRRALRPSEEYRTPTDEEWEEFLGHFQRRKVALGDCGRAYGTSCQHEHSCIRCPLLRVDPAEKLRLLKIHSNLGERIIEAEQHGWLGEAEGLRVSLAAAEIKLAQLDERARRGATINLGIPSFSTIAGRTAALQEKERS
ncbi:site-specific integrase [Streptosporangium sp. NPDC001681]|uniref:tyrosine-type recombinase/integrase n=1 Tax=Streptosporangium sp. NPDC001681 TaxID=3154395 RepID=UPI003327113C